MRPRERTDGVDEWMLRLRIYPDEFSIRRRVPPPTPEELDRLDESIARMSERSAAREARCLRLVRGRRSARLARSALWRAHVVTERPDS